MVFSFLILTSATYIFFNHCILTNLTPDTSVLFYSQALTAWLPVTAAFVVCNWFGMKLFKHNH